MYKTILNKHIIILSLVIVVSLTLLSLSSFLLHESPVNRISDDQNSLAAVFNFNTIVDGLDAAKPVPVKKDSSEEKDNSLLEFVLFLGCAVAVFTDKGMLAFLKNICRAVYNCISGIHKTADSIFDNGFGSIRLCILEFLNPLQKMLFNRADEFDIEHVMIYGACRSTVFKPHLR